MTNEWAGLLYAKNGNQCGAGNDPYVPCDDNSFALEIDDANGMPVTPMDGTFAALVGGQCVTNPGTMPADAYVLTDGTAVAGSGASHDKTSWDLCWTAPKAGRGPLTLYVSAVDGNGGDGTDQNPNDTVGDDVFIGSLPIPEKNGQAATPQNGACAVARGASGGGRGRSFWLIGVAVGVALLGRRVRKAVLLALLLGMSACTTVRPWQKDRLAKRIMRFSPDPDEDELDLHMLEAREGSAGGYGSAGGGCGCN
jgi:hypothetical protein